MTHPPAAPGSCELCRRLNSIKTDPALVARLSETSVILADNQGCPGWCVLILNEHVEHLATLPVHRQARVFGEVARVAAAIRTVFPTSGRAGGPPRINYECLGNLAAHVHWHVIPRHADDPTPAAPVWGWPAEQLRGRLTDRERRELAGRLRAILPS